MKQEAFLKALKKELRRLKRKERERYVESYRELLADMTESGMPEEEAVAQQGDVKEIAAEILSNAMPSEKRMDIGGILLIAASILLLMESAKRFFMDRLGLVGFHLIGTEAASVGIIGGADGPTAIFVTSTTPVSSWMVYLLTVLVIVLTVVYLIRRRQAQRQRRKK